MTTTTPAATAVPGMPRLADVGVAAYRVLLRTWTDDELTDHFLVGLDDEGVDENGDPTSAGGLMYEEWMMRLGHFDDLSEIIAMHREAEGEPTAV